MFGIIPSFGSNFLPYDKRFSYYLHNSFSFHRAAPKSCQEQFLLMWNLFLQDKWYAFSRFFPSYFVPKYKNVKKNVNGAKDEQKKVEQTILTQVVTTSVYLIWIDDDDDGGCGEGFFFFFYAFVFEGKQNKKSNTGYFLHGQYSIHSLNSCVGGFLRACLHGGGGPQVSEVTRLGGVTCLSI